MPFLPSPKNFRGLISYQKAECIYDLTFFFCKKFLDKKDRTVDQMIQAARSGKQNIAEGCAAATTSAETEIKLTNVAKASLQELLVDYEDFLRVRGFPQWAENSRELKFMRELGRSRSDSAFFMKLAETRPPETIANMAIVLIKQTDYLLFRLIRKLEDNFLANGGIRERMTRARLEERSRQNPFSQHV